MDKKFIDLMQYQNPITFQLKKSVFNNFIKDDI